MAAEDQYPEPLKLLVRSLIAKEPAARNVIDRLDEYYTSKDTAERDNGKRRKTAQLDLATVKLRLPDVLVVSPVRKKLLVLFGEDSIVALKDENATPEFQLGDGLQSIRVVLVLQVPERAKPQWNVVVVPSGAADPLILTVNELAVRDQIVAFFDKMCPLLPVVESPAPAGAEATKSICVSAHRGSKEGLLYLLDGWIFFGFKKPLAVFSSLTDIDSVFFSSVTRLTFNMSIKPKDKDEVLEFSMIDQADYSAISDYVEEFNFANQSMSEKLKAKPVNAPGQSEHAKELEAAQSQAALAEGSPAEGQDVPAAPQGNDDDDDENDLDFAADDSSDGSDSDEDEESENDERDQDEESENDERDQDEDEESEDDEEAESDHSAENATTGKASELESNQHNGHSEILEPQYNDIEEDVAAIVHGDDEDEDEMFQYLH